jgi:cytochrome c-type biogenesis protein CcmH/NrfG
MTSVGKLLAAITLVCLQLRSADSLTAHLSRGRFQEALAITDSLLRTHPRDARLWTTRGLALAGLKRTKEGLDSFDRALELDSSFLRALKAAAETAYRSRDSRARAYLDRLLRLESTNETAHAMSAVIAFEANDCRTAVAHFEQSRSQVDGNETASSQFGHCLLQAGQNTRAEEISSVCSRRLRRMGTPATV